MFSEFATGSSCFTYLSCFCFSAILLWLAPPKACFALLLQLPSALHALPLRSCLLLPPQSIVLVTVFHMIPISLFFRC
ncbi:hypothetical protein CW304_02550 [Bacillus sp. UFRGS-B20]|nr:hypothetical protein CW304_02550 [Bacillus sp. UFRGS-B20]